MALNFKNMLRRTGRWSLRLGLLLALALVLMEILYRYQVVDSYRRELNFLNPDRETEAGNAMDKRTRVLVMGDSFSAAPDNWVDHLRKMRPDLDILNSAVPGTGVRQANFMASRRFSEQQPQVFIYQIYVGNDLFDLRYPWNWEEAGVFRNLYWAAANRFRSLSWLNYALGQFQAAPPPSGREDGKSVEEDFDPGKYSPRERLYLKVESDLILNSAFARGSRRDDLGSYLSHLRDLVSHCEAPECKFYLLVIPHCAQVNEVYAQRMKQLGAQLDEDDLQADRYPFLTQLDSAFSGEGAVLNALPALKAQEKLGTATYFNNDIHLSPAGQRAVAELVGGILAEK